MKRTCLEVSELRSQMSDGKIRLVQRVQIWVHSRVCKCPVCKGLEEHLLSLRDCVRSAFADVDSQMAHVCLDEDAKQRLRDCVHEACSGSHDSAGGARDA